MRIIISLLFIVAICWPNWSQKMVIRAQHELQQHNYGRAYSLLHEAKAKHPLAANYILSTYYLSNFAWNADSAFFYYQQTQNGYSSLTEKQKKALKEQIELSDSSLAAIFHALANKEFAQLKNSLSLEKTEQFRNRYSAIAPIYEQATLLRDSLAYANALALNQSDAFFNFILRYPDAIQIAEAQLKYEELYYLEQTSANNENLLAQFILNNPNHRYINQAWLRLYELTKSEGSLEAYTHFARRYPNSPNVEEAWREVYKLYMQEYSVERLASFKKDYPDYPDIKTLESDGALLLTVLYPWLENGKYGYIDQDGKLRIACSYDEASAFYDGAAIVASNGKIGLINKKNEILAPFQYDEIFDPQQRTFIAKNGEVYGVLNHLGKLVIAARYKDIQRLENGALMLEDSLGFYLSRADGVLFNTQPMVYEEVEQYIESQKVNAPEVITPILSEPNLPVIFIKNGKKGLKLNGKEIVAASFEDILPFQAAVAIAKKKGKYGLIDANGKTILNFDYSSIRYLSGLGFLVEQNGLLGIYEINKGFTIPIAFEAIKPFEKTYLLVSNAGKDGLLTLAGKQVLETKYQRISRFDTETLFLVQEEKISYFLEKENRLIERIP
ncbi:MAG: WG repeat-containing protein [Flavobacteriales bacterium]